MGSAINQGSGGCQCTPGVVCNCFGSSTSIPLTLYATITSTAGKPTITMTLNWFASCNWRSACQITAWAGAFGLTFTFSGVAPFITVAATRYSADCLTPQVLGGCDPTQFTLTSHSCSPLSAEFSTSCTAVFLWYNKIVITA